jgi:hypothetical protein
MALLITGIGAGVFLYAASYMAGHPLLHRFLATLTLFMAAMLGAVPSDDLLLLFVFWELTSLASFLLIGFDAQRAAREAGRAGLALGADAVAALQAHPWPGNLRELRNRIERAPCWPKAPRSGPVTFSPNRRRPRRP